ncbi:hypothetical protein GCM10007160_43480 [Litchfieldella qijiaojingensis]|uniref:Uncharacterized protein n=1 Tax=Litchfieldella qijiaojingensis TaxID=980347 RepID=A0ABQ2ZC37_9GAMM|nr:YbhB/YbcL family Raf kinase inhibitor-like protein [Halomonas qijiaojingensis]GGY11826.1 hypothetical protein GCM10007160_43480 [Halomonas qijiaojingensis]
MNQKSLSTIPASALIRQGGKVCFYRLVSTAPLLIQVRSGTKRVIAVEGRTDFGASGYGGACPPVGHGDHHYQFTVYALSEDKLSLDDNAPAAMVGYFVRASALDQATIEVTYSR